LIVGLEVLLELGAKDVEIRGDSELVIKQLTKEYKHVKENLIIYFAIATALLKRFDRANIPHVPRIENQEANDLAQIASGYRITEIKFEELIKIREKLSSKEFDSDKLSTPKLGGGGQGNQMVEFLWKFLLLTIYETMIGEHQLLNTFKIRRKH